MPIVALIAAAASIVWGVAYARRGSLVLGLTVLLVVGYVFSHAFWHARVGPLPLTLDRVLLVGLSAAFVAQWRWGKIHWRQFTGGDWLIVVLMTVLSASALMSGQPEVAAPDSPSPLWRLVMSFLVPAGLYVIARTAPLGRREWLGFLAALSALGTYLALTALAEITQQWSVVFPRFISEPLLGIHFGRARGPDLNSASLGVYLVVCLAAAWTLKDYVGRGWQLVLLIAMPLMAFGVLVTYTRSTWLGLVGAVAVIGYLEMPHRWRLPAFSLATLAGVIVIAATWSDVVGLKREGTAAEAHHSVDQRTSFAYVSWQMFKDRPIFGAGFGRFYDRKLPYLSDRSQPFELESIRPLHHHNTLLSLLTETGMVGLAAFVALMVAWTRNAWSLVQSARPAWARRQGELMLAALVAYLSSAVFHDLTLLPNQHWLLFVLAGLTVNLRLSDSSEPLAAANRGSIEPSLYAASSSSPGRPATL